MVSSLSWQTTREHQSVTGDLGRLQYSKDPGMSSKGDFPYIPILGRGCFHHQSYSIFREGSRFWGILHHDFTYWEFRDVQVESTVSLYRCKITHLMSLLLVGGQEWSVTTIATAGWIGQMRLSSQWEQSVSYRPYFSKCRKQLLENPKLTHRKKTKTQLPPIQTVDGRNPAIVDR